MSKQFAPALAMVVWLVVTGCQSGEPSGGADGGATTAAMSAGTNSTTQLQDDTQAVATIGDRTITVSELDEFIKDDLFAKQSSNGNPVQLYEMRSKAVGRFIEKTIIEDAASAKGLSIDEYMENSVVKEGEIPDEEVAAYYEANRDQMGDATLEEIDPRIRSYLRAQLATEFVSKLLEESNAMVLLEPVRIEVATTGPSQGPEDAPITIVEFSDFQCPYCKRVVPTLQQIIEKYPDEVRIVFRHLPLDRIHDRARPAAEASACADQQNGFWAYHDILFENNRALSDQDFTKYAGEAGLDIDAFEKCVADREFQAAVEIDSEAAAALGLRGTPAFFINGIPMRGAKPIEEFTRIIESELTRQPAATPST